jgi:hypothetical protein
MRNQRNQRSARNNEESLNEIPLYVDYNLNEHAKEKLSRERKMKKKGRNKWNHEK